MSVNSVAEVSGLLRQIVNELFPLGGKSLNRIGENPVHINPKKLPDFSKKLSFPEMRLRDFKNFPESKNQRFPSGLGSFSHPSLCLGTAAFLTNRGGTTTYREGTASHHGSCRGTCSGTRFKVQAKSPHQAISFFPSYGVFSHHRASLPLFLFPNWP